MKKLVIVSGYFNPLHKGHLELFKKAKEVGDLLCVIVNNDKQRELKGSKYFQDEDERIEIGTAPVVSQNIMNQGTDLVNQLFSNNTDNDS